MDKTGPPIVKGKDNMSIPLFAVEVDADWLKALGVLVVTVVGAVSYAFVRMSKRLNINRTTNATTDIAVDESKAKLRSNRDKDSWKRMNLLFKAQDEREKAQDKKIEELVEKARKFEVAAAECLQREIEHAKRDKERDEEDSRRDKRIRDLERQLGIGIGGEKQVVETKP